MKLRNKKTGDIGKPAFISVDYQITVLPDDKNKTAIYYNSLAELNEDWEDYIEEPKKQFYIDCDGRIWIFENHTTEYIKGKMQEIGNYFKTREEAEKAVEKLKAWKRLKDKGFVWQGWEEGAMDNGMCVIGCQIPENNWETDVVDDLDLLFGGEE